MEINERDRQIEIIKMKILEASKGITERKKKISEWRKQLAKLTGVDGLPWTEKSMEFVILQGELVTSVEILKYIFASRPQDLEDATQRRKYMTGLSVALNKLCKVGKLKSHKPKGVRGLAYGLPAWWIENDELGTYYRVTLQNKLDNKKTAR